MRKMVIVNVLASVLIVLSFCCTDVSADKNELELERCEQLLYERLSIFEKAYEIDEIHKFAEYSFEQIPKELQAYSVISYELLPNIDWTKSGDYYVLGSIYSVFSKTVSEIALIQEEVRSETGINVNVEADGISTVNYSREYPNMKNFLGKHIWKNPVTHSGHWSYKESIKREKWKEFPIEIILQHSLHYRADHYRAFVSAYNSYSGMNELYNLSYFIYTTLPLTCNTVEVLNRIGQDKIDAINEKPVSVFIDNTN